MRSDWISKAFLAAAIVSAASCVTGCDGAVKDASANLWSFSGYCGRQVDAACPAASPCTIQDGGVAQTGCSSPVAKCIDTPAADSGLAQTVFTCQPMGHPIWNLNAICGFPGGACSVTEEGPVACPATDAGVEAQPCSTPSSRCLSEGGTYWCLPGNTLEWIFNGYCGVGPTPACDRELSTCPAFADGGFPGSPCDTALTRCVKDASSDAGDAGMKVFVCSAR